MTDLPDDYTVEYDGDDDVEPFDTAEPFDDDEPADDIATAEDATAAAHYGRLHVTLPSGAVFPLLSAYEARFVQDRADRYQAQNHFQNISDLADIDRLLTLELFSFRWTHWLSEGQDYSGEDINDTQLRKSVADYCVDEETEILTVDGWQRHDDLKIGQRVLTLNTTSGLAEWQPLRNVHVYRSPHPVIELSGRDHVSVSTPNHRWPVRSCGPELRDTGPIEWVQTWRLLGNHSIIRSAVGAPPTEPTYADPFVEIIGWFWTEGTSVQNKNGRFYNASISQSWRVNAHHCSAIEQALTDHWGPPWTGAKLPRDDRGAPLWRIIDFKRGIREYHLSRSALAEVQPLFSDFKNKVLHTRFLVELTQAQLVSFIAKSVDADGWTVWWDAYGSQNYGYQLAQGNRERATQFSIACILAGRPVKLVDRPKTHDWLVNLVQNKACSPIRAMTSGRREPVFGVCGLVWCPETENGTWFARRNGTHYYTGNSVEIRRLKAQMGVDKTSRDKARGEDSVSEFLLRLLQRGREFGVHRDEQAAMIIELGQQLIALMTYYDNMDDVERREAGLTKDDFFDWIRNVFRPEFEKLDVAFRLNQKMWIRDL